MNILSIETSCDETAISIVECEGGVESPAFRVLAQALYSQASKHAEFGGVYPNLAKRLHSKNLFPILIEALKSAEMYEETPSPAQTKIPEDTQQEVREILEREPEIAEALIELTETHIPPNIDAIAVTEGPGLAPALWVGVNFARALALLWNKSLMPVNHMEGHVTSVLADRNTSPASSFQFPLVALLVSGGHTELIVVKAWGEYKKIGQTRDDAAGEAFDKVARMLDLPYPGGPHVSRLAEEARAKNIKPFNLPRPMIDSPDLDFSFSGLKTAVLYATRDHEMTDDFKHSIARGFEEAVTDVLLLKTKKALQMHGAHGLILGGGVVANSYIRTKFTALSTELTIPLFLPDISLAGDNAVMIALAAYLNPKKHNEELRAQANLTL